MSGRTYLDVMPHPVKYIFNGFTFETVVDPYLRKEGFEYIG